MSGLQSTLGRMGPAIKRQFDRESISAVLHVIVLLALFTVIRPLFSAGVGAQHYEAHSIVVSLILSDFARLLQAATRHQPAVPEVLFLLGPTLYFVFAKRRLRWTDWQHGTAFRAVAMGVLAIVTWAGAALEYNNYMHQGHVLDRVLMVILFALSWRTPLAFPFATRLSILLIREAYTPIVLDDFEFRTVTEMLTVFSVFIWASARRSFQPWHVLVVGLGSWASYYYIAGWAKWNYGPKYSWLLEDRLTNLAFSSHMRGWLPFISEETFNAVLGRFRPYDMSLTIFTLVVEFGALVAFYVNRNVARVWFFLCFGLHFGIFAVSGVCFWKWMLVNWVFIIWMSRAESQPLLDKFYRHKLALLVGVLAVYFSGNRIWFFPQTHVVWWDTQFLEQYDITVVGKSGEKYVVDPNYFAPQDMHMVQGAFCYATDNERAITHIYGTTGSYEVMKKLNEITDPKQALELHKRGPVCSNATTRKVFDDYMKRFFGNINRYGRPYDWISQFSAPHHLWVGTRGNEYKTQEKVTRLELWRTLMFAQGGKYHVLEKKLTHTIPLPNAE